MEVFFCLFLYFFCQSQGRRHRQQRQPEEEAGQICQKIPQLQRQGAEE